MKMREISGQSESQKEFPEAGVYKDVRYRIDGDSVMLTSSSGKEVQVGPDATNNSNMFDIAKIQAVAGKSGKLPLSAFRPSTYEFDTRGANGSGSEESVRGMWEIL